MSSDVCMLPAVDLCRLIKDRELSAVELIEACLKRLEERNPELNAVCTVSPRALKEARGVQRRLDRGEEVGPLAGLPVGIKDITPVRGLRTTFGSPLYRDWIPDEDALVVARLRASGAVVLGKTNTPEFAAGGNTFNEVFGLTRNPWNPALSAGGSTGGGAVGLATGMIAIAEGTDLGGSLRIPASFCGVAGLRPSIGLVPTVPTDSPWDGLAVTGPMARTVTDIALTLQVISGPDPRAPLSQAASRRDFPAAVEAAGSRSFRIGYAPDVARIGVDPAVESSCRAAALGLGSEGHRIEDLPLDLSAGRPAFVTLRGLWMLAHHHKHLDRLAELGDNVAGNIRLGLDVTTTQLAEAEQARFAVWEKLREVFAHHDVLMTPCMAIAPFPVDRNYPDSIAGRPMDTYIDWLAPTFLFSLTGLPVACVPCGLTSDGMPAGLQVVGRPNDEESVLQAAHLIQEANPIGWPPASAASF